MSDGFGVGVIGRGVWGCHSLEQQLLKREGVRVVAVTAGPEWGAACFDDTVAAGRVYASELSAEYREDWRDITSDPEIDIISLMTSPATRKAPALAALKAGKHVVVDKPLAATVDDARVIADAEAGSQGVGFMLCGYHTRETVRFLRRSIDDGMLGETRRISVELRFTGGMIPGFQPSRRWLAGTAGGELTTIGTHALMTLLYLADAAPVAVSARIATQYFPEYRAIGAEDWGEVWLRFADGMLGTVRCGRVPFQMTEEPFAVDVLGTLGAAELRANSVRLAPSGERFVDDAPASDGVDRAFASFFDAISSGGTPATTFADGLLLARILDAAYRSAREGGEVALSNPPEDVCGG